MDSEYLPLWWRYSIVNFMLMLPSTPAHLIWRLFISFCRIICSIIRTSILNCRTFGSYYLCEETAICLFVLSLRRNCDLLVLTPMVAPVALVYLVLLPVGCIVVMFCCAQAAVHAMSEFAAFSKSFPLSHA